MLGLFKAAVVTLAIVATSGHLAAEVKFETVTVHGRSLVGNLEGNSPDRAVIVYLPPSYAEDLERYYKKAFKEFYFRPSFILKRLKALWDIKELNRETLGRNIRVAKEISRFIRS